MWTQRFVGTAGRSRLAFHKEAHRFCQIRNTSTSLGTRENKGTRTRNFFLGVGFVSAGLLLYPSKVYAAEPSTKWKKWASDYKANEENPNPQVAGLRGMGATQTASSNFDAISLDFLPFTENTGYICIGIYDSHHGGKTAINLSKSLPEAVSRGLGELHLLHAQKHSPREATNGIYIPLPGDPTPPDEEIDETIRRMFKAFCLDDALYAALQANNTTTPDAKSLVGRSGGKSIHHLQDVAEGLRPTWCSAGALLGIYNVEERTLRVGLTGNSRAVLRQRVPVGQGFKYETHQHTTEQDTSNPDEVLRLTPQHPDEHDLLKDKRLLGYSKTRVFGNGPMKWSRAIQTLLYEEVIEDPPSDDCLTPPYATAEPVVTTMKDIKNGDFAIFASDGL
ncbi:hypothetical protein BDN70DRAFT_933396 [Pholiota conissans]|uniref:PPM-type phosphatase domain-containing protein n=1 Tax=Pholiota conissans TaxID=109636 RepID=A0A9P6CTI1_9AGAR|nr:hypothetical protein BDN70DRAFT_933396 [Pholiota conissans]